MATSRNKNSAEKPQRAPATTPEQWENRITAKAMELVERQIEDGTVSAQVLSVYVRNASSRMQLENEKLRTENDLLKTRMKSIESGEAREQDYQAVLKALSKYQGREEDFYDD